MGKALSDDLLFQQALQVKLNGTMRAHCCEKDAVEFSRIKKKKWGEWRFLILAEWSQSPMNQGDLLLYVASTPDKRYWAILKQGFPRKILVVANVEVDGLAEVPIERITAAMMNYLRYCGGEYFDVVIDTGGINYQLFMDFYKYYRKKYTEK